MSYIIKNCLNPTCNTKFNAPTREVNRGNGKFCCRSCSSIYARMMESKPEPNVICALCRQEFYMNESKKRNSKSGFYFCCRAHKDEAQRIGGVKEIMPSHYGTGTGESTYREIVFRTRTKQCERCSFSGHPAAIVVHHKDKNRQNNSLDNLEVLCANCHAIEHWSEQPTNAHS